MKFTNKDVKKNYLGILIKDIKNLGWKIEQFNYIKSLENIQEFREKNSVESNINNLIKFISTLNEKQDNIN